MRSVSVLRPSDRAALISRALGVAWPLEALVVVLWLLVPHSDDAREGWVVALCLAGAPLHVLVYTHREVALSRARLNIAAVVGIAQMCGLVWPGAA